MTGKNSFKQDLAHTPNQVIQFYQQEGIQFLKLLALQYFHKQPTTHMLSNVI